MVHRRLMLSVLLGQAGHVALAAQSQIPVRVGDCVKATTHLEFFYKDEGEYEKTHLIKPDQTGVLLNVDPQWGTTSTVEFLDPVTREPQVQGAVFLHQFARVPWMQGRIAGRDADFTADLTGGDTGRCMTIVDHSDGYQPVVKMQKCAADSKGQWTQQFSFNQHDCAARPIRSTQDPSKCLDAVHPRKALLTDCSGVDSQKFLFRCAGDGTKPDHAGAMDNDDGCYIQAMGGRRDMCLWWDPSNDDADIELRTCNFNNGAPNGGTRRFKQNKVDLAHRDTREV